MVTYTHKIGDTFYAECTYTDGDGTAVSLDDAGITVSSSLQSPDGRSRLPMTVDALDQIAHPGRFNLRAETAGWQVGTSRWDIQYVSGDDFVTSTETMKIAFEEDVTL